MVYTFTAGGQAPVTAALTAQRWQSHQRTDVRRAGAAVLNARHWPTLLVGICRRKRYFLRGLTCGGREMMGLSWQRLSIRACEAGYANLEVFERGSIRHRKR